MLAACGKVAKEEQGAASTPSAVTNANGQQEEAAKGSNVAPAKPQTQTVEHGFGKSEVPLHPQRIAVIGHEDILLSLGAPIVYAFGFKGYYLENELKQAGAELSGSADVSFNLEAILASQPDLIVLQQYFTDEKGYEELSKIAPTIAYKPDDWKTNIKTIGKVLGLEEKAASVIADYEDKLQKAKETIIKAVGSDATVAYIRPSNKDLQVFFPSFAPLIYDELGLKADASIAELQKGSQDDWGVNTSLEKLPSITADYVFAIYGGSIDSAEDFQKYTEEASEVEKLNVWKSIPAVGKNHVFKVSARHWMSSGPTANGKVIDDVVAALTGK
ncbi:ABC transporter substrate-binding protein [Paenibacillus sp. MAHUQ-46]|uniref:ABC transporter substrate-binding protein n=2 Tax=Paenibacillus TaxID=44249 RepID=A0A934MR39_9BACL|nr:ABC transporter substrate-binding protein [Paenibacillus roseus]